MQATELYRGSGFALGSRVLLATVMVERCFQVFERSNGDLCGILMHPPT
jgi:hypothetical protein